MSDTGDAYDDEALAAEYVLHLLDVEERSAFEKRMRDDRGLQARVNRWEEQLAPLSDEVVPVTPSPALKSKILKVVAPASRKPFAGRTWSLLFGGAVVVVLMAAMLVKPFLNDPSDQTPAFQAELSAEDGSVVIVAGVIPATHEIVIERVAGAPRPGRVHELWLITEGTAGPVSLGVLEDRGTTRIRVPDDIAPGVRTGTLAISDEPPGGSPTGVPTGEVLATATFVDI